MTREEAIQELLCLCDEMPSMECQGWKMALDIAIQALEQEPKTGHWIEITNKRGTVIALRCSCCEKSPKHAIKSDFCPHCGVDMRGEK